MIELHEVTISYGEKTVLRDFSLALPESGIVCLSGPSGCGKTTLARVLAGLEIPEHGQITGLRPGEAALLFQEDRLLPWLSAARNVAAVCSADAAREWLRAVGLDAEADAIPASLSGGMRRRVALARALAYNSRLLLLDEPFTGIDADTKRALYPLIEHAAQSKPVVLITHHKDELEALGGRILRLSGPPLQIL